MYIYTQILKTRILFTVFSILLATAFASAEGDVKSNNARASYEPISELYGYLQENEKLDDAVSKRNRDFIRKHAWKLWAGMMQPLDKSDKNSWPIWFSWQTSYQAFKQDGDASKRATNNARRDIKKSSQSALSKSAKLGINVMTSSPKYPVPAYVIKKYPGAVYRSHKGDKPTVSDGTFFVNNGDIMIAVESLSQDGFNAIRDRELYQRKTLYSGVNNIPLPRGFISTKHMYWPVKADSLTALPVWNGNFPDFFIDYAGYELWNSVVAINTSKRKHDNFERVEYLYGVKTHNNTAIPTQSKMAKVVPIDRFYHHRVTKEDWQKFSAADKAIINSASLWLSNKPFEVGDYLVTIAAHIITKEIDSWTMQSVWWSHNPNQGQYAENRPELPRKDNDPWDHYLLTDSYDLPVDGQLEKAVNPYIEGVTHPIATSCRNCHFRAGVTNPESPQNSEKAGYQSESCPGLLTALKPENPCFKDVIRTDFSWIISDRALPLPD